MQQPPWKPVLRFSILPFVASPRLSANARAEIAQRTLDRLGVTSGREAFDKYGRAEQRGPGLHRESAVDEATGLHYRMEISATLIRDAVLLSVGIWPLPERMRSGGALPVLADLLNEWRNAPVF